MYIEFCESDSMHHTEETKRNKKDSSPSSNSKSNQNSDTQAEKLEWIEERKFSLNTL